MTTAMLLGSQATGVAERITDWMSKQQRHVREEGAWARAVEIAEGGLLTGHGVTPHLHLPAQVVAHLCMGSAVEVMWRRSGRIAFAMHPDLMTEIADTTSEQLAGTVFQRLPYTNPLIVLPAPIPAATGDGHPCRILGFYAYGTTQVPGHRERRLCTTHDPRTRSLGLMVASEILDFHGRVIDFDLTRVSVPVQGRFTVTEAIDATLAAYRTDPHTIGPQTVHDQREWISTITRLALNILLYLCSRTPDLTEPRTRPNKPARAKTKTAGTSKAKKSRIIQAGWRLGPALRRARAQIAHQQTTSTGAAGTFPPQHRRCHLKTVWTGPGRTVPDIAFVLSYWTHTELLGLDTDITVVPVPSN